ncbi:lipase 3-like [Achroia grisella]|uniref:lipase 3-like n=1 Tax=Achroia grisella TaxID=688607 RepID=UPI0027D339C0|nr:lipase 3-like [Achroia grisella]
MITRRVILVILCGILKITCGEKCTLFDKNNANVPSDIFNDIKDYANGGALNKFFNVTGIESVYNEFQSKRDNEDIHLNITQLLTKYKYPVEQHQVLTSDGYLLTMFRIPNDGPAVFVMHGLFSNSDDFITIGPDSGLAYLLADAGYDVWLGNARGNKHSRSHISLSPSCAEFWDFSWDEIGRYDLPAMIDYILNATKQDQLIYIGHSQGPDFSQINATALPVIFGHTPAGVSTKQLVHYAQLINSNKFRQFDYGLKNLAQYGSVTPPDYNIEKITSPLAIFFGLNDWFNAIEDVNRLKRRLPNIYKFITVPYGSWSHVDYLFARDVKELLYIDVLNVIEEY